MASTSAHTLATDHTCAFRQLVEAQGPSAQEAQQRWRRRRDEALGPVLDPSVVEGFRQRENRQGKEGLSQKERDCLRLRRADEEWIKEAIKVHRTITSLVEFLRSIRRPYLAGHGDSGMLPSRTVQDAKANGEAKEDLGNGTLEAWKGVHRLSDKERDEIEFQIRVTIKRCLARIKGLEEGEAVRKRTTLGLSANPFSRLLGSATASSFPGRSHPLYAEQLSQHRHAITQYLNNRLAQANARMGDLQEARLKAQRIKQINLAGSAATVTTADGQERKREPVAGSVRKPTKANGVTLSVEELKGPQSFQMDFSAAQLTAEQIQQFDKESSALVESLSDDLRAVEAAERKLSEISELQTQLIQHLGNQAEMADNLHQEAMGHTLEVGKGNEQLQRAKDNNRQANKFLCYFLIGSGLGLLFLHWMD